jgi:DNA mismatch repair enzyme (predicted ATPase)
MEEIPNSALKRFFFMLTFIRIIIYLIIEGCWKILWNNNYYVLKVGVKLMQEVGNLILDNENTKFEEDYLTRTYSKITNRPDLALTELVANAWDSGALKVKITITPLRIVEDKFVSIEDDGIGMSEQEFYDRWMTLAYNRLYHQGEYAEIPPDREHIHRHAYGRNGIGRHSMLCFSREYAVETWKDGICNTFELVQSGGKTALKIKAKKSHSKQGHGTIITARIDKNYPDINKIQSILSARFMYDPQFELSINNTTIGLEQFEGIILKEEIQVLDDLKIEITALSSEKTARRSQQHGIAFWINKRLVGDPSWILNKKNLADGRTTIARQYTIIVQTNDMLSDVTDDWTEFKSNDRVYSVYEKVEGFINKLFKEVNKEKNEDLKKDIIRKYAEDLKSMDFSSRREVIELVDQVVDEAPDLSKGYLDLTVSKFVEINKSRNKKILLEKIFSLTDQDAEKLGKILEDWNVSDIEFVLDEIDRRLAAIQAIQKFSSIDGMDELHVLHPLVLESKWLFGAEYDSSFYVSNSWLSSILKKYLKRPEKVMNLNAPQKRPDIIFFDDGSLIGYATEELNPETNLMECKRLLLIELKCGGKEITPLEVSQTEEYMNELFYSNAFNSTIRIDAFTVGDTISNRMGKSKDIKGTNDIIWGHIVAASYSQLVSTAERRLFGLKNQLSERYESMGTNDLLTRALSPENGQIALEYIHKKSE